MYLIFIINFLLAVSTTVGMTVIPFLVTDSLGLSLLVLGLIEGSTEFISNVIRLGNGILFDKVKNKRMIFAMATGIAFVTKLLLLAPNVLTVTLSKTLERVANGAFASPRDAYVAEKAKNKGLALGLLGFSKSAGCILGPLLVSLSVHIFGDFISNMKLLIAFCCSIVAIGFFCSFFLEIKYLKTTEFSFEEFKDTFKKINLELVLIFLYFIGRFNDGFLMIYLKNQGFPYEFCLSTIAVFNSIMLISSPIIGSKIDQGYLKQCLYVSIGSLILFNCVFYNLSGLNWVMAILGLISWGIQRSGSQIVFASLVFKQVSKSSYGTAIGIYYLVSGFSTFLASLLCGYLTKYGFKLVFLVSGSFAMIAMLAANYILNKNCSIDPLKAS